MSQTALPTDNQSHVICVFGLREKYLSPNSTSCSLGSSQLILWADVWLSCDFHLTSLNTVSRSKYLISTSFWGIWSVFKTVGFLVCWKSYCKIMGDKSWNLFTVTGLATDRLTVLALLLDGSNKDCKSCWLPRGMYSLNSSLYLHCNIFWI